MKPRLAHHPREALLEGVFTMELCARSTALSEGFEGAFPRGWGVGDGSSAGPPAYWKDFRAAFGLGTDDKHIATVDADGVALAAIQGLNQKLEQRDAKIARLEAEMAQLKRLIWL